MAQANVKLTVDGSQATRALKNVQGQTTKLNAGVNRLKTAIGGIGFTLLARQAVNASANFEKLKVRLGLLTKENGSFAKSLQIAKDAQKAFGLSTIEALEGVTDWAREYIINNFVDEDHFEDLLRDEVEYYVEDIKNEDSDDDEQWESRFDQEMEEYEASDEEDLIDKVADSWSGGDAIEYYKGNYGEEWFYNELSDGNNIDVDTVIAWLVDQDGDSIEGYEVEATEIDDQWYYVVQID